MERYNFIRSNYETILEKIKVFAEKYGREPQQIKLIAVSKTMPSEDVRIAYEIGMRDFGENYAQELRDKSKEIILQDLRWHFIGRLQTNKIKYIVPSAYLIHSVYRLEEVEEIDKQAQKVGKVQNILIEVNVSSEQSKGGLNESEVYNFVKKCCGFKNVKVVGLMTMAPFIEPHLTEPYFEKLKIFRDSLKEEFPDIQELSMGMTNDFEYAIKQGSTMLRIGTAIFGERVKK